MKILIVKLSSLGDVLHNLPMVWDLRRRFPQAQIDWVVEEGYQSLLKPMESNAHFAGIDHIIPLAFRRWRKSLKKGEFIRSIQEFITFKNALQETSYDVVIDTQGLIKSAVVCSLAKKVKHGRVIGLANRTEYSGYEPLARTFYTEAIHVPSQSHAVDRSRWLAATVSHEHVPDRQLSPPQFYPEQYVRQLCNGDEVSPPDLSQSRLGFDVAAPYVLCFHSTAREAKRWSEAHWVTVGQSLSQRGLQVVLPWGNEAEKAISLRLAKAIPRAVVPDAFSIEIAYYLIARSRLVIGVDTGLTHVAAILNRPTIEIYCDSPRWKTEAYWSKEIINLGDRQLPPSSADVLAALERLLVV